MKHLNISDDAMKIILENAAWADFGLKVGSNKLDESAEQVVEEEEAADEHVCPLCQSHLDEAISDEALMEHTANILEAVNAATLNEEVEEDADDDDDELYEEDESDDDENSDDEDETELEEGQMPAQLKKAMMMKKKGMKKK